MAMKPIEQYLRYRASYGRIAVLLLLVWGGKDAVSALQQLLAVFTPAM